MNIQFYSGVARGRFGGFTGFFKEPSLGSENVTTTAVSAQSTASPAGTRFARITVDTASYVKVGTDPTAIIGDILIPANGSLMIAMTATDKIAGRTVAVA